MPQLGKITGSRFSDMLTGGRGKAKWGKTSLNLAMRIAAERMGLLELDLDGYTSRDMEWGNEQEEVAIQAYERKSFVEVENKQVFQQHPKYENVGVTPDGMVGNIVIEVKNPKSENHLLHLLNGWQIEHYKPQLQGSLWVCESDKLHFVSHDSRINDPSKRLDITIVRRDEGYIKKLEARYLEFENKVSEYIDKLN